METQGETNAPSFDEIKKNRGSEWHKWDLHIHTPKSFESKYGGDTPEIWEKFVTELEQLDPAIKVIGINDYLFLDGYKEVLKYRKTGRLQNIDLILPVFEFRLKQFVGSKELGRINYHIAFADESLLDVSLIESQFLNRLVSSVSLDSDYSANWAGVLTRKSLQDLGQAVLDDAPQGKKNSMSPVLAGFNNLNFSLDDIEKILGEKETPNTYLKNKYFKIIGKNEWEDFRWDGSPGEKKSVINSAHFVFAASDNVEQANKGLESLKNQDVNSRLLHCSDAHWFCKDKENTKPKDLGHCFLWIKGETTFEGLRYAYYEPDLRIKIQKEEPDFKSKKLIIDYVQFKSDSFTSEPIYFNRNLNVIIGGKSSGKSILLYYIAYLLRMKEDADLYQTKNDLEKAIDRYRLHEKEDGIFKPMFDFHIHLASGASSELSQRLNDLGITSILPSLTYIPQNYLSNLADVNLNKTDNKLNKIIRKLLLEDDICNNYYYEEFIKTLESKDERRNDFIDNHFRLLNTKSELQEKLEKIGNSDAIKINIENSEKEISELQEKIKLTDEQKKEYADLNEKLISVKREKESILQDKQKIIDFALESKELLGEVLQKKKNVFENVSQVLSDKYANYFLPVDNAVKSLQNFELYINSGENNSFIENLISTKTTEQEIIEKALNPLIQNNENQKKIDLLTKTLNEEKQKAQQIVEIHGQIKKIELDLEINKTNLFKEYKDIYKEYTKLSENFETRISAIKAKNLDNDLNIVGKPIYNFSKFKKKVYPLIHGNRNVNSDYEKFPILQNTLSRDNQLEFAEILRSLSNLFDSVLHEEFVLKGGTDPKQFLKTLFYDYFYDSWIVIYKEGRLGSDEMSTGKASYVILMLIVGLSKEKAPILIDQPEDNLDNRSISKELVTYLREKKQERQIILVTHNPNVVVNADAENVIVAEQKGQRDIEDVEYKYKFDYINGALENSFIDENEKYILKRQGIKEHVAEIVEGGEEAFIKRERKYNFQKKKQ